MPTFTPVNGRTAGGGGGGGGGLPTLGGWTLEASRFVPIGDANDPGAVALAPYDPKKEYITAVQRTAALAVGAITLREAANVWGGQSIGPVFVRNPILMIFEAGLGQLLVNAGSMWCPDGMLSTTVGPIPVAISDPGFASNLSLVLDTPNSFTTFFVDSGVTGMLFLLASRIVTA